MHANRNIPDAMKNLLTRHTFNIQRFTHYIEGEHCWYFLNANDKTAIKVNGKHYFGGASIRIMKQDDEKFADLYNRAIHL